MLVHPSSKGRSVGRQTQVKRKRPLFVTPLKIVIDYEYITIMFYLSRESEPEQQPEREDAAIDEQKFQGVCRGCVLHLLNHPFPPHLFFILFLYISLHLSPAITRNSVRLAVHFPLASCGQDSEQLSFMPPLFSNINIHVKLKSIVSTMNTSTENIMLHRRFLACLPTEEQGKNTECDEHGERDDDEDADVEREPVEEIMV